MLGSSILHRLNGRFSLRSSVPLSSLTSPYTERLFALCVEHLLIESRGRMSWLWLLSFVKCFKQKQYIIWISSSIWNHLIIQVALALAYVRFSTLNIWMKKDTKKTAEEVEYDTRKIGNVIQKKMLTPCIGAILQNLKCISLTIHIHHIAFRYERGRHITVFKAFSTRRLPSVLFS